MKNFHKPYLKKIGGSSFFTVARKMKRKDFGVFENGALKRILGG
jgi:hypothetical protein